MNEGEDFVFYGTPIEREEELISRKKKATAEASGQLRTLPAWKQEVRDEEGRRRFHGAFTGGFSAGYYNTVGSKEGWAPQKFTSSRKNRAEIKQQSIFNFMDDDEKAELEGRSLSTTSQFDTFGFTAAEVARKKDEKEQHQRPSAIPGPIPDELLAPVPDSIGVKLLLKMGWRRGRSITDSRAESLYETRREARKALLAFAADKEETSSSQSEFDADNLQHSVHNDTHYTQRVLVYVQNPKLDLHGLGYDPYKHAPEFREKKRYRKALEKSHKDTKPLSVAESLFGLKSGKATPGFGIGALEEYDVEDEDVYETTHDFEDNYVKEIEEHSRFSTGHKQRLGWKTQDAIPGFMPASRVEYCLERFDPPVIPKDFIPNHKFAGPLAANKHAIPQPPEAPAPDDSNLKTLIDGVASLVARCGQLFENLQREKNRGNPLFSFLEGGNGHDYYARRVWEEQSKRGDLKLLTSSEKSSSDFEKLTATSRGKILGEKPLERSSRDSSSSVSVVNINLQLSDNFTKPTSFNDFSIVVKPFNDDPLKQERFEKFLREKYEGGLRSTDSCGSSNMSEAARARERLDFEAAAEAIEKAKSNSIPPQIMDFRDTGVTRFTSAGEQKGGEVEADDTQAKGAYPRREEFQWRPMAVLCKRFDLLDPYMGKPPPPPRQKTKLDSLVFTADFIKSSKSEKSSASKDLSGVLEYDVHDANSDSLHKEVDLEENVARPVDLYKAIFSDDEDDVPDNIISHKAKDPEKKSEVAHTTLNRLIAGDFLESLGKELGIEVPPEMPYPPTKPISSLPQRKDAIPKSQSEAQVGALADKSQHNAEGHSFKSHSTQLPPRVSDGEADWTKGRSKDGTSGPLHNQDRPSDSSSSGDERSTKHSRRHRRKKRHSDSSSDDDRKHYRSESREESSRKKHKSRSRRHSKHDRHGSKRSADRSSGKRK